MYEPLGKEDSQSFILRNILSFHFHAFQIYFIKHVYWLYCVVDTEIQKKLIHTPSRLIDTLDEKMFLPVFTETIF